MSIRLSILFILIFILFLNHNYLNGTMEENIDGLYALGYLLLPAAAILMVSHYTKKEEK